MELLVHLDGLETRDLPSATPPAENTRGPRNPYQDNHFAKAHCPHKGHHDKGTQCPCLKLRHLMKATDLNSARSLFRKGVPRECTCTMRPHTIKGGCTRRVHQNSVLEQSTVTLYRCTLLGHCSYHFTVTLSVDSVGSQVPHQEFAHRRRSETFQFSKLRLQKSSKRQL